LLLAATVRSIAHMLLGISDRNTWNCTKYLKKITICCRMVTAYLKKTWPSPLILVRMLGLLVIL